MSFFELMMIGVAAFFVFVLLFAKFAHFYDSRRADKKKSRAIPKLR